MDHFKSLLSIHYEKKLKVLPARPWFVNRNRLARKVFCKMQKTRETDLCSGRRKMRRQYEKKRIIQPVLWVLRQPSEEAVMLSGGLRRDVLRRVQTTP